MSFDQTAISESIDRLCNQSVTNIDVPKFDAYNDVHDFMAEFERVTVTLNDEQKLLILPKAFPVNCYRAWYNTELSPLIKSKERWSVVKRKILSRFSQGEEQDKHFSRLRDLKFDTQGTQSLLAYIEDVVYSYGRAHPGSKEVDTIKYMKMTLPPSLRAKLNLYPDFKDATNVDMIKNAAKEYDLTTESDQKRSGAVQSAEEFAKILKAVMTEVKKETQAIRVENETVQKELIAAIRTQSQALTMFDRSRSPGRKSGYYRQNSPGHREDPSRGRSPGYRNISYQNNRGFSPGRNQHYHQPGYEDQYSGQRDRNRRPQSPANSFVGNNNHVRDRPPTPGGEVNRDELSAGAEVIFEPEGYFDRFGRPPGPCPNCKGMHWVRHCFLNLK